MFNGARILVAPLDWGLGHTTRCIPIIHALLEHGATPILGADGAPHELLTSEFPDLEQVRIPGVDVRYGTGRARTLELLRQLPSLLRSIRVEHKLLGRLVPELRLDAVISDQRFGLYAAELPSALITHQVFPRTPIAQAALRGTNHRLLKRFDRCWVMDVPEAPGLAGELSHGRLPVNARYIGTVSRFSKAPTLDSKLTSRYRIVAVISGPEPLRGMLETRLINELQKIPGDHLLVRGVPSGNTIQHHSNLTVVPHMNSAELEHHMALAELIISRSGYTTLMDLQKLGRSALLIPTPGQPEQEYLGALHGKSGAHLVRSQDRIDIGAALSSIRSCRPMAIPGDDPLLERALKDFADLLHSRGPATFIRP